MNDFFELVYQLNLRHFSPNEFLFMGDSHSNPHSRAYGKNEYPPRNYWENILPTALVIDEFRARIDAPVFLTSIYRSPEYNKAVGGAVRSQHVYFRAIDFTVRNNMAPSDWGAILKQMRAEGIFSGGIGIYSGFVHIDTRGTNDNW